MDLDDIDMNPSLHNDNNVKLLSQHIIDKIHSEMITHQEKIKILDNIKILDHNIDKLSVKINHICDKHSSQKTILHNVESILNITVSVCIITYVLKQCGFSISKFW